ncbi:hypothetical protein M885DRAFT_626662, partial [Pelagophyceae sp. CCMP2097]
MVPRTNDRQTPASLSQAAGDAASPLDVEADQIAGTAFEANLAVEYSKKPDLEVSSAAAPASESPERVEGASFCAAQGDGAGNLSAGERKADDDDAADGLHEEGTGGALSTEPLYAFETQADDDDDDDADGLLEDGKGGGGASREETGDEGMDVFVMTLNDVTVTIPVRPSDRIDDVLRKIDDAAGVQVGPSSLVHNGVYMAGDRTIGDYGIRGGSTLCQVLRARATLRAGILDGSFTTMYDVFKAKLQKDFDFLKSDLKTKLSAPPVRVQDADDVRLLEAMGALRGGLRVTPAWVQAKATFIASYKGLDRVAGADGSETRVIEITTTKNRRLVATVVYGTAAPADSDGALTLQSMRHEMRREQAALLSVKPEFEAWLEKPLHLTAAWFAKHMSFLEIVDHATFRVQDEGGLTATRTVAVTVRKQTCNVSVVYALPPTRANISHKEKRKIGKSERLREIDAFFALDADARATYDETAQGARRLQPRKKKDDIDLLLLYDTWTTRCTMNSMRF